MSSTTIHKKSAPKSKNLLIVNKGPGALPIKREGDDWDLLEIYFMPADIEGIQSGAKATEADHIVFERSRSKRKFAIIKTAFEMDPFWREYDCFIMADDDVLPVGCTFSDMLKLFRETGCRIGQPALTQDSFFSHILTVKNDNFLWRRSTFIEVMCPIFTRQAVIDYMPVFDATVSNFGLDCFWGTHEWMEHRGGAVLDQTPIKHTRPVGGGIAYQGVSAEDEFRRFIVEHRLPLIAQSCFGGQSAGEPLSEIFRNGIFTGAFTNPALYDFLGTKHLIRAEKDITELCLKILPSYLQAVERDEDAARLAHVGAVSWLMITLPQPLPPLNETRPQRVLRRGKSFTKRQINRVQQVARRIL